MISMKIYERSILIPYARKYFTTFRWWTFSLFWFWLFRPSELPKENISHLSCRDKKRTGYLYAWTYQCDSKRTVSQTASYLRYYFQELESALRNYLRYPDRSQKSKLFSFHQWIYCPPYFSPLCCITFWQSNRNTLPDIRTVYPKLWMSLRKGCLDLSRSTLWCPLYSTTKSFGSRWYLSPKHITNRCFTHKRTASKDTRYSSVYLRKTDWLWCFTDSSGGWSQRYTCNGNPCLCSTRCNRLQKFHRSFRSLLFGMYFLLYAHRTISKRMWCLQIFKKFQQNNTPDFSYVYGWLWYTLSKYQTVAKRSTVISYLSW